jgi:3-methyladenine DNA glycosylase/8-oxoguanine DNA glycosylase
VLPAPSGSEDSDVSAKAAIAREAAESLPTGPDPASFVDGHGLLELTPAKDSFEFLVGTVVGQQISSTAARAIENRLRETVALTPEGVLATDVETLREAGLSARKAEYVRNLAQTFRERQYDRATFKTMDDKAIVAALVKITGVGQWTAERFLLFGSETGRSYRRINPLYVCEIHFEIPLRKWTPTYVPVT